MSILEPVVPPAAAIPVAEPVAPAATPAAVVVVDAPAEPVVAAPDAPAVAASPVRPEGIPDAFWDAATGFKTTEAVARLGELEAADTARRADVPADASGYKLELSTPITDPTTGNPIGFNAEDPLAKAATAWAHQHVIPQTALSGLLAVFAQNEMANLAAANASVAAETAKLGENGQARLTAVSSALAAHAGVDGAKSIMANLAGADAVIALEKVVKALGGPAIGSPPAVAKTAVGAGLSGVELLSAIRAQG